jgi:spore germination protein KB
MSKIKITPHQLFTLVANGELGGSIILITSIVAHIAKQDAWISALVTPVFGLIPVWLYYFLGSRFPEMSLVGINKKIFGKWAGILVSLVYVFMFLLTAAHLPWYIGVYAKEIMHETPLYVLNFAFVAAVVIALLYGLEAIARASEVFFLLIAVIFFISIALVLPQAKLEYMLPVFENGLAPVLKGSFFISCYVTFPGVLFLMIYPQNIIDIAQAKKALFKGYLWTCLLVFVAVLVTILVLGSAIASITTYPTIALAREINVGNVLTRVEYIIPIMWTFSQFIVGVLFFYAGITGLSELLGLKDYKKIVLPFGLIILLYSGVVFPDSIDQSVWVNIGWAPFSFMCGFALPLITAFVYTFRKRLISNI